MSLSAGRKITLEFFIQIKSCDDFIKLPQANPQDFISKKKEFGFKITINVQISVFKLLEAFEMIIACGILRSGFKTFNRSQGQGGLGLSTPGISGIFRRLAVTVQHGD